MTTRSHFAMGLLLGLLVSSGALAPGTSAATSRFPPYRPITEGERLANSCELADVIAVVTVEKIYTEFYRDLALAGEQGMPVKVAECSVSRLLKGSLSPDKRVRIQLPGACRLAQETPPTCGVVFLARSGVDRTRWSRGAHGPIPVWVLYSGPDQYRDGFAEEPCTGGGTSRMQVSESMLAREPARLATRSDIVVIADVPRVLESCTISGRPRACATLSRYVQLYGEKLAGAISVAPAIPGYLHAGRHLLYLRRRGPSLFEIIGLHAGAQAIVRDSVGHDRTPLDRVMTQVQQAESARIQAQKGTQ